nr:uncharacterized protein LOC109158392 [Ipomoea batatas]
MAEIGKQGAPVNVMKKTFSGLSNMLNVASTIEATSTPTSSQLDDIFFGSESFTTAVDALLQLDPTHEWMKCLPMEKKKQNFYERMTYEIERLQNLDINDADLIFFPVLRHGHYFLICINVKASKLEIIDNKSLVRGVTMKDKYGDCATLLVTALKEYLALGSSALFWKVDELTEEVVDMSWKESENYIDCGLFVMRHMETYKGTLKKWNPGFRKKASLNENFLIGLRASNASHRHNHHSASPSLTIRSTPFLPSAVDPVAVRAGATLLDAEAEQRRPSTSFPHPSRLAATMGRTPPNGAANGQNSGRTSRPSVQRRHCPVFSDCLGFRTTCSSSELPATKRASWSANIWLRTRKIRREDLRPGDVLGEQESASSSILLFLR